MSTVVCAPPRGRPRDEQATRAILAAALEQLDACGYAHVSMESVAAQAGVSRATVYRRFSSKADLVTAAIASNGGAPPEGGAGPSRDPVADLVTFLSEFEGRFGESCLQVIGALLGSREDPDAMALHRDRVVGPRVAYVAGLLEAARDRGLVAADADLSVALEFLFGAVFARRVLGVGADPGWARRAVEAALRSLAPPGAPRR